MAGTEEAKKEDDTAPAEAAAEAGEEEAKDDGAAVAAAAVIGETECKYCSSTISATSDRTVLKPCGCSICVYCLIQLLADEKGKKTRMKCKNCKKLIASHEVVRPGGEEEVAAEDTADPESPKKGRKSRKSVEHVYAEPEEDADDEDEADDDDEDGGGKRRSSPRKRGAAASTPQPKKKGRKLPTATKKGPESYNEALSAVREGPTPKKGGSTPVKADPASSAKKKRGRPPKSASEPESGKKKRGRPPKSKDDPEDGGGSEKKKKAKRVYMTRGDRITALKDFFQKYGYCNVCREMVDYESLGRWADEVRHGRVKLTDEEKQTLKDINFPWTMDDLKEQHKLADAEKDKKDDDPTKQKEIQPSRKQSRPYISKEERIQELKAFKNEFGHCKVDRRLHPKHWSLANWVDHVRKKRYKISDQERQELDDLGFPWTLEYDTEEEEQLIAAASKQRQEEAAAAAAASADAGEGGVGGEDADGDGEGGEDTKDGKKTPGTKKVYRFRKSFEQRVKAFQEYKQIYKVDDVPYRPKDPQRFNGLAEWVKDVRRGHLKITKDQRKILNSVGFNWETKANRLNREWKSQLDKLKAYKAVHGHTNLPWNYPQDKALKEWTLTQKKLQKKGQLRQDRLKMLENIGFQWSGTVAAPNRTSVGGGGGSGSGGGGRASKRGGGGAQQAPDEFQPADAGVPGDADPDDQAAWFPAAAHAAVAAAQQQQQQQQQQNHFQQLQQMQQQQQFQPNNTFHLGQGHHGGNSYVI